MFEFYSKGVILLQEKEPAFSREILTFFNNTTLTAEKISFPVDLGNVTIENLVEIAREAGIVDERDGRLLYKKLNKTVGKKTSRIIVDAMDDEPYVSSQMGPLIHLSHEVIGGLNLIANAIGECDKLIYVYKNLFALNTKIPKVIDNVPLLGVGGRYPAEHGTLVNTETGDMIIGVCSLIHLFRAVYQGQKQTTCFVTVAGNCIANPRNLEVSLGMTVMQVLERCGLIDEPNKVIIGGPMTGIGVIDPDNTLINTTTRAVLAFKEDIRDRKYTCIGCGRCVDACPANLHPMYIYKAAKKRLLGDLKHLGAEKCIGCGTCSYVCPAKLELTSTIYSLTEHTDNSD
ncbi:MAG: SLBB domain-containing protein [Oscillospiraceae bacterium]